MNPADWPAPFLAGFAAAAVLLLLVAGALWVKMAASLFWLALLRPWPTAASMVAGVAAASAAANLLIGPGNGRALAMLYLAPVLTVALANLAAWLHVRWKRTKGQAKRLAILLGFGARPGGTQPPFMPRGLASYVFDLEKARLREEYELQRQAE